MARVLSGIGEKMTTDKEQTIAFKAFDPDMSCRGFKYKIGKTYEHSGDVKICRSGFHAVTIPFDAWSYYNESHTFARVIMHGETVTHEGDSKIASAKITIEASITLPEWIKAQVETVIGLCKGASGSLAKNDKENAAATGDRGHAAATGTSGIAASLGVQGTAQVGPDGWIVLASWGNWDGKKYPLLLVKAGKVGTEGIEAGKAYWLDPDGKFIEAST